MIKSTGAAFNGDAKLYASYIDPTTHDFGLRVPGSMMGQDANNMFVLQSTGMIAVEMESSAGEPLQLANGKPSTIKVAIPASLINKAPATIATWSLDDRGMWIKEGTATKNGSFYETTVNHFSFWNCDYPMDAQYLTIHVVDQNGNPLPNTTIQLTIANSTVWWATTTGKTDATGNVAGLVPAEQELVMSVFSDPYTCISPVLSQNIGPFSSDTTITVSHSLSPAEYIVITGSALDCNGNPLANGFAAVQFGNYSWYFATISNGSYTLGFSYCSPVPDLSIIAYDNSGGFASSGPINISGAGSMTIPPLTVCNANPNAVYNLVSCQQIGTFAQGAGPTPGNYIMQVVEVLSTGPYEMGCTWTVAGGALNLWFRAAGTFTHLGLDTVEIESQVAPLLSGTYDITQYSNGTTCTTNLVVFGGTAVFSCLSSAQTEVYQSGIPINGQTHTIIVDVTTPGTYSLTADWINGVSFNATGTFTTTGPQPIVLNADGWPTSAGTFTYVPLGMPGPPCSFPIIVN